MADDDYDTPWKDALTRYLPEFLAFYFPAAHGAIDWNRPHTFLDQELAQVVREAEPGKRWADRLVEVATHDAGPQWVYIHIEVQGQQDVDFAERLFVYNYRLYDRYRRPVPPWRYWPTNSPAGNRNATATNCSAAGTIWSFPRSNCSTTPRNSTHCSLSPTPSPWSRPRTC